MLLALLKKHQEVLAFRVVVVVVCKTKVRHSKQVIAIAIASMLIDFSKKWSLQDDRACDRTVAP